MILRDSSTSTKDEVGTLTSGQAVRFADITSTAYIDYLDYREKQRVIGNCSTNNQWDRRPVRPNKKYISSVEIMTDSVKTIRLCEKVIQTESYKLPTRHVESHKTSSKQEIPNSDVAGHDLELYDDLNNNVFVEPVILEIQSLIDLVNSALGKTVNALKHIPVHVLKKSCSTLNELFTLDDNNSIDAATQTVMRFKVSVINNKSTTCMDLETQTESVENSYEHNQISEELSGLNLFTNDDFMCDYKNNLEAVEKVSIPVLQKRFVETKEFLKNVVVQRVQTKQYRQYRKTILFPDTAEPGSSTMEITNEEHKQKISKEETASWFVDIVGECDEIPNHQIPQNLSAIEAVVRGSISNDIEREFLNKPELMEKGVLPEYSCSLVEVSSASNLFNYYSKHRSYANEYIKLSKYRNEIPLHNKSFVDILDNDECSIISEKTRADFEMNNEGDMSFLHNVKEVALQTKRDLSDWKLTKLSLMDNVKLIEENDMQTDDLNNLTEVAKIVVGSLLENNLIQIVMLILKQRNKLLQLANKVSGLYMLNICKIVLESSMYVIYILDDFLDIMQLLDTKDQLNETGDECITFEIIILDNLVKQMDYSVCQVLDELLQFLKHTTNPLLQ